MEIESLKIFLKVAELGSFTRAAEQLGMPKSKVSLRVSGLEEEVGNRLLQRTTRAVRLTPDGEQFVTRARRLTLEADELASMFSAPSNLRGKLRIDLPVKIARDVVIPRLPEFLATHPNLEVLLSSTDRRVEVVQEGFDCVLRVGALPDSSLIAKRLGFLPMTNFASAAYLRKYGVPRTTEELDRHFLVHYSVTLGSDPPTFEYRDGDRYRERPMRALITVNNTDAYHAACAAGLGIIQAPSWGKFELVESGVLVQVLPDHISSPLPVSLVHAHGSNVPKRVRAILAWLTQLLQPLLPSTV